MGDAMRGFGKFLVLGLIMMIPLRASAGILEDYKEAEKMYLVAAACMAAYSNRPGSLAVEEFERQRWKVESYKQKGEAADAKFLLAWDTGSASWDSYLLAVAGTESARDLKVDLRTRKVYFAGSTLEEFAANAAKRDLPPEVPRVHEGFNQVAQVLLSVETAESQDDQAGKLRRLTSILLEDTDDKVILVGHSLGGAVAAVVAARLVDMGVRPEQIEVVSLGAPAVGNEAFVQRFDGKFPFTRIVVAGDPVPQALRRVFGGYRQFGREIVWNVPDILKKYMSHEMPVYLDMAIRNFYAVRRQALEAGVISMPEPIPGRPRLYIAPVKNSLPKVLQGEFALMREGLLENLEDLAPGYVLDPGAAYDATTLQKAAAAGCDLAVVSEIEAHKLQDSEDAYYVSLIQTVYRSGDGVAVTTGSYGSNTKVLTPLLALMHDAGRMQDDIAVWVNPK